MRCAVSFDELRVTALSNSGVAADGTGLQWVPQAKPRQFLAVRAAYAALTLPS